MNCPVHLGPLEADWPAEFEHLDPPPNELWLRGRRELLSPAGAPRRLAIVGTRTPTPYGLGQAAHFAGSLARLGVTIVSGLARGIDAAAHAASLGAAGCGVSGCGASGATVAVLGSGVDRVWPASPLAERMAREGLLLSEYPPGTPPRRHHFPQRNRLIAALAPAVLVVEAAYRSGSLITAQWAADLGREVLVIPGPVDGPGHRGCHRLIRQGALLVESPYQVLEALGWLPDRPRPADELPLEDSGERPRSLEWQLLEQLGSQALDPESLATRIGCRLSTVLGLITRLELAGALVRTHGGRVRRAE
ncbi:MAG: DNA-processing protein DprA [Planctomycetota bacterium]